MICCVVSFIARKVLISLSFYVNLEDSRRGGERVVEAVRHLEVEEDEVVLALRELGILGVGRLTCEEFLLNL